MYIDLTRLKNQKYNSWTQFCNLNFVAWLVMTSATILAVGQYLMIILPAFCTRTLSMKWCPTSMCFDLCRLIGFFDEAIVPWLSSKIKTGSLTPLCHSLSGWDTAPPPPPLNCCRHGNILSFTWWESHRLLSRLPRDKRTSSIQPEGVPTDTTVLITVSSYNIVSHCLLSELHKGRHFRVRSTLPKKDTYGTSTMCPS